MNALMPLIFDNVTFAFDEREVISSLSFELNPGEHLCLTGANGIGKSTALKLADGLLLPASGKVLAFGIDTATEDKFAFRKYISFVMQNPQNQIVHSRVIDDVEFGPKNLGLDINLATEALETLGASELANKLTFELSGGEAQLVALAGAIATKPKLLLLDEPTSMLDAAHKKILIDYLKKAQDAGVSVLSVTHDVEFLSIANRKLELIN